MRFSKLVFVVLMVSLMFVASAVFGDTAARKVADVLDEPAIHVAHLSRTVFLSVTTAGKRLVAVGEHGRVALSDDNGGTWRQAKSVPVRVTLTSVSFASPQKGWAVGHSGVVLHTEDGGETWSPQLDGKKAAQLVFDSIKGQGAGKGAAVPSGISQPSPGGYSPAGPMDPVSRQFASAKRLVDEGPDKPFLCVYAESEENVFILGAYNLIFRTVDGGKSWQPWQSHVENPREFHLYAMRRSGPDYYIAGEQGLLLRSTDGGNTFKILQSPYEGSFFGLIAAREGELVVFGLRGNAFRSEDHGRTWKKIEVTLPRSISAGTELADGTLLLTTFPGDVLVSRDHGRTFQAFLNQVPTMISDFVQDSGGGIVTVGMGGVHSIGDLAKLEKTGKGGAAK